MPLLEGILLAFTAVVGYAIAGGVTTALLWPLAREDPPTAEDEMVLLRMAAFWPWYATVAVATGLAMVVGMLVRWRMRL